MKILRALCVPAAFLLAGLFSGCEARVTGPGISFASEAYDYGTVGEGAVIEHEFEFTNNGTETLMVSLVATMSESAFVRGFSKEVVPGGKGKIAVSLDTKGLSGTTVTRFQMLTNAPDKANLMLVLAGTVNAAADGAAEAVRRKGTPFWRVQRGETRVGASSSSFTRVKIVFTEPFSGIPKIVATVRNEPGWKGGDAFAVTVRAVTETQFIANIVRVDKPLPWTQSPLLDWTAWE